MINPPPAVEAVPPPAKKTVAQLKDEYIAGLLGEIIAYQNVISSYKAVTQTAVPSANLKAAIGITNSARDRLQAAEREEKIAQVAAEKKQ